MVGCLRKGETGERRTMRTSDLALYHRTLSHSIDIQI
nr:MAG TPA: hypothetical protein [Crassvirales sp.]